MNGRSFFSAILSIVIICGCSPKVQSDLAVLADVPREELTVGFYNLENLFDIDDDPQNEGDQEWLPTAEKEWTAKRYQEKLGRLAQVIAELGKEVLPGGPVLLGVCEVENERVLRDLIQQPPLAQSGYDVIHFESADARGIDCGLLYRTAYFTPGKALPIAVNLAEDEDRKRTTRDILWVEGSLKGDSLAFVVNHWPSRFGGEKASRPGRDSAASVLRRAVQAKQASSQHFDILIVGDFNDDPISPSITQTLQAEGKRVDAAKTGLYNPMLSLYRQGIGTLGYRDSWNLFDQLIVSEGMATPADGWTFKHVKVFRKSYMLQKGGRYRNYPLRTYVGSTYTGGYSDHLPIYGVITRPKV